MLYGKDILTGGTATADSYWWIKFASYACDNNEVTYWAANVGTPGGWWKYNFGTGVTKVVRKLRIKPWADDSARCKGFTLYGSNNDSDYTAIYTGQHDNDADWEDYIFSNSTAYQFYKITFNNSWVSDNGAAILELEMMEKLSSPFPTFFRN
jgi:hypothetical protein